MTKLYAGRFENNDTSAALLEQFKNPEAIGVRTADDSFGVVRIEVTIHADGPYDAYQRYRDHHGQRLALYDSTLHYVVSANITSIELLPGDRVQYVAASNRFIDDFDTTQYAATTTVSAALIAILSAHVAIDDGTTTNITTNSTAFNGWQPESPQGSTPFDAIQDLLRMSDSSNRIYDFWLVDQPLLGTNLRQFTPYYTYRRDDAGPDWIVKRKDLGALTLSRDINDFATTATVWYGIISGIATSGSDTTLVDTTRNFITGGVQPGDQVTVITKSATSKVTAVAANSLTLDGNTFLRGTATGGSTATLIDTTQNFALAGSVVGDAVYNDLDDSRGVVTSISTTTSTNDTINMSGAMSGGKSNGAGERYRIAHQVAVGDTYAVRTKAQTKSKSASVAATYWERDINVFESAMDGTQAAQYAPILADTEPQQRQAFTITAPYITDANGARWPLFAVVARGNKKYIQVSDLFPAAALSSTSRDRLTTFRITSLDYDGVRNSLRVSVDTLDTRLDTRLRRAKILGGEMVSRG